MTTVNSEPFSIFTTFIASSPVCTFKRLPFTAVISKRPFLSVATRTNGFSSTETKAPATGFPFSSRTLPVTLSSLCAQPFKVTQANIAKASILYFFIINIVHQIPATACAIIVAHAAPATPILNTIINTKSKTIFIIDDIIKNINGVLLSPRERIIPDDKL